MKKNHTPTISIRQLAEETGSDRASIGRWLAQEGIPWPVPSEGKAAAIDAIRSHQGVNQRPSVAVDPKTGLSWFQASLREDTRRKRRENDLAEKQESADWMPTAVHYERLALLCDRLECLPSKLRTLAGLSDAQSVLLRRELDAARAEAAAEIKAGG